MIDDRNLTQDDIAQKVGKDRATVSNFLRLLKLPDKIKDGLRRGLISMGHARALISVADERLQLRLYKRIVETGLSVSFTFDAEEAHLEIADDGIGFNMPANMITLTRNGHYGLAGGAERVDALGGEMKVGSMAGQGTRVHVTIPLQSATLK